MQAVDNQSIKASIKEKDKLYKQMIKAKNKQQIDQA